MLGFGPHDIKNYGACIGCLNHVFCGKRAPALIGSSRHTIHPLSVETPSSNADTIQTSVPDRCFTASRDHQDEPNEREQVAVTGKIIIPAFGWGEDEIDKLSSLGTGAGTLLTILTLGSTTPSEPATGFESDFFQPEQNLSIYRRARSHDVTEDTDTIDKIDATRSLVTQVEKQLNEPGDDENHLSKSLIPDKSHNAGQEDKIFACPFFKNNPHQWKNVMLYATLHIVSAEVSIFATVHILKRLLIGSRQHLTGSGGPHTLHECATCLTCFADAQSLQGHKYGPACRDAPQYYPAEGVGCRLSEQFEKQLRGLRSATYQKDSSTVGAMVHNLVWNSGTKTFTW